MTDRAATLGALRQSVRSQYQDAVEISTNELMNPATPMAITVVWPDKYGRPRLVKAVRAKTVHVNHDAFTRWALGELEAFYRDRVAGR